jgi:hypothetical protein
MLIGTICTANQLPHASCLARSLKETQPRHTFVLCFVERDLSAISAGGFSFANVVLASELGIRDFESFMFRHNIVEACSAIKAQFFLWLFNSFPEEQLVVFLAPEIRAYSRFEELEVVAGMESKWPTGTIIVTPHHLLAEDQVEGDAEGHRFRMLTVGTFNLGFLAVRRSQTAVDFLLWWNRKLQSLCYMEWSTRGIFLDQKWLLLGISFFDMSVLREPGYSVAHWNVSARAITSEHGRFLANGAPLRFFQFANMEFDRDICYFRQVLEASSLVFALRDEYKRGLEELGEQVFCCWPWSYGSFTSGATISPEARLLYRNDPRLQSALPNPFGHSDLQDFYLAVGKV